MKHLPAQQTKAMDALFVDVREQEEWDQGHIENALFAPLSKMSEGEIPDLPKDKDIIIYCRSGQRSQMAIALLEQHGHKNCINMADGYLGWMASK